MKCPSLRTWLPLPLVLLVALAAYAMMHDDDFPGPGNPPTSARSPRYVSAGPSTRTACR